ncbi:MAG TPA: oxidoreductase [Mycobacterium sp.]|nr:oxidoreductase [Mycobacterium sp.]
MGLFDKFRSARRNASGSADDQRLLREWAAQRTGVEAYVEPETSVTPMTVVLVAADGEWTRRPAGGPAGARRLGEQLAIPVYDVQKVGYPQRMRDYDARRRIERRRALREELDDR